MRNFLWIIAEIGVFLVWKNAERHVGKKNIAIEVKSGKDYARHRALNNILDCSEYNIPESVVLYVPIYMVMFIHKDPVIDVKFSLDLSGL